MKTGNTGGYLLPYWKIVRNDKNNSGKIQNFIKSTKKIHQHQNQEQRAYLQMVMLSRIQNQVQIILERMYLLVSNELMLSRLTIQLSIVIDFQF